MEKELSNKVSYIDFSLICRTCLSKVNLKPLEEIPFGDLLKSLTDIQIEPDDGLPGNICYSCINKLEEISTFITVSKNNDQYLKHIVQVPKTDEVHYVEETEQANLNSDIKDDLDDSEVYEEFSEDVKTEENSSESLKEKRVPCEIDEGEKSKDSSEKQEILCSVCSTNFSTKKLFEEHQRTNVSCKIKQFNCNDCHKAFFSKFRLNSHMRTHTKETPYECKDCLRKFRQASNLKRHIDIIHKGLKPFKCEVCGKEFSRLVAKNEHTYKHTGQKPYVCSYCGETFNTYLKHFTHTYLHKIDNGEITGRTMVARKSNTSEQLLVECTVCNKTFSSPRAIFQHSHAKESSGKEFLCAVCGKAFLRKSQLQTHSLIHSGEKPFICKHCGKQFRHASGFKSHILIHTGEKPYRCPTCQKGFVQSDHLKQHMKVHTGERPYKCSFCEKYFAHKCNLVVHERVHTGQTPYFCSICKKGFYDSTRMKKHEKGHANQAKKKNLLPS
nr:zinc finger protein 883-like isoform X2 [Leptinotarsa decemlineata]